MVKMQAESPNHYHFGAFSLGGFHNSSREIIQSPKANAPNHQSFRNRWTPTLGILSFFPKPFVMNRRLESEWIQSIIQSEKYV
jgi:hypothetical protein